MLNTGPDLRVARCQKALEQSVAIVLPGLIHLAPFTDLGERPFPHFAWLPLLLETATQSGTFYRTMDLEPVPTPTL
jgi:hypothetical protein